MSPRIHDQPDARAHPEVTVNLHRAAGNWGAARARAKTLVDWDDWRDRAQAARADAVANMPELLDTLEARVSARGGRVHRAATIEQANARIVAICRDHGARVAVKGKSMTSEETGLAEALGAAGVESVETDLGEWIVQLLGQRPSHILAPAVHLNAGQVAELFSERAGRPFDPDDTQALVRYARGELRERFLSADVGITGANLAVASTGTLAIVESEGNIRLSSGLPRVHVVLMGIEKVVRDWDGAAHLLQMLPLASHGRLSTASTSLITGPARDGDDGPAELHVVLLDDGRSSVRGTSFESALHCIRCGACLYACPVYRQVGGHAYGSTYTGPIGAVVTPLLERLDPATDELPWLSSLCGACTEACPVGIPLDEQLVALRAAAVRRGPRDAEATAVRRLGDACGRAPRATGRAPRPPARRCGRCSPRWRAPGAGTPTATAAGSGAPRSRSPAGRRSATRARRRPSRSTPAGRGRAAGGRGRRRRRSTPGRHSRPRPPRRSRRTTSGRRSGRPPARRRRTMHRPPLERFGAALAAVGGELGRRRGRRRGARARPRAGRRGDRRAVRRPAARRDRRAGDRRRRDRRGLARRG